ncbi:MAG: hypothetical protein ETSY1_16065 [Candidatus Entotheonella factor]|uniref:Uncharacterized protein n=1 Tax=Entotheonella factor TaxID=1429438 RepID=W4LN59_ENTF1|nr:hypothetical protein [Candidatus Entotheonella palauensis]ETW99160.1 MAG: hypothetical protein ETSY1_16065 [Candidatus Entotheonella factor]
MKRLRQPLTYRGMVASDDLVHAAQDSPEKVIAPSCVEVPGGWFVAQYAPTVVGTSIAYDPPNNCDGNFMSSKFQPNNNCYNYACNIATNSYAQPGRKHGLILGFPPTGPRTVEGAQKDGLIYLGGADMPLSQVTPPSSDGHLAALFISPPSPYTLWLGDYHWVRSDDRYTFQSWSQKDGGDQVTNFDFAGHPITNPAVANWTVNLGWLFDFPGDLVVNYDFYAWMWIPENGVHII